MDQEVVSSVFKWDYDCLKLNNIIACFVKYVVFFFNGSDTSCNKKQLINKSPNRQDVKQDEL